MYELTIILVVIGVVTLLFSVLLILFPDLVLKTDERVSELYLMDSYVIKHRVTVGVFSFLLILFPDLVLETDARVSQLYLTDWYVIKHRVTVGVFSFFASCLMLHTYFTSNIGIYCLSIGFIAFVYSVTLLFFPSGLLKVERHANKIYMTDDFFYKNKNIVGAILGLLSFYMIFTFITLI